MHLIFIILAFLAIIFLLISFAYFISPKLSPIPFFPTNQKDLPKIVETLLEVKYLIKRSNGSELPLLSDPPSLSASVGQAWDSTVHPSVVPTGTKAGAKKTVASGQDKKQKELIIDLGAGTGTVIFAAASLAYQKRLPTKFIAIDIHPLLFLIMNIRRLFHPNRKNIEIIRRDIFKMDYVGITIQQSNRAQRGSNPAELGNNLIIYLYVGPFVMEKLKEKLIALPKKTTIVSYMYEIPGWSTKLTKKIIAHRPIYVYSL